MDVLEYARDLVAFESTSSLSNVPVCDYVEDVLRELGFVTERLPYRDANGVDKDNVIGKKGAGRGGMGYFGHVDVVPADPWFTDDFGPFTPTVDGDRLYGRGSCDMKGSVACMLAAAGRFSTSELKRPIYITCTADEETGFGGAAEVARRSDLFREMVDGEARGIIGEPTLLEVVHAHKGMGSFTATSYGAAAHSSTREGKNANLAMIPFLAEMKRIHDECESDPAWQDDGFDPPTIGWNILISDGDPAFNVKAPKSVCRVSFRPMPGQDWKRLIDRARKAATQHGLELEADSCSEPLYTDPDSPFIREVLELAGKTSPCTVSYGTDGPAFSAMKYLVVYGPGSIDQAHTHDEWIALDQLERGAEAFAALAGHWCTRRP